MLWRAPTIRRDPSLAIPAACQAACSVTTWRSSSQSWRNRRRHSTSRSAAAARDLLGLRGALGVQRLLGLAQHLAAITARPQPLGQLVAARLAEQLVLGRIDARGVLEDLPRDLLIAARRVMGRRRGDLRAVDRDHADLDQAAARTQRQHLAEQAGDRRLVTDTEARDRRVIGRAGWR